ncbi:MAG: hypothetical protein ACI8X5_002002 [Planctomycetota bacterium]|jgi:hypothetical protein
MHLLIPGRVAGDLQLVSEIAETLGREALAENGIWLGAQLSRQLDSPSS